VVATGPGALPAAVFLPAFIGICQLKTGMGA
jgi:hypothetical protein